MDKDKLNEAARNAYMLSDCPGVMFKYTFDTFIAGADWLMQQPLSERLTDEEKKRIRECMNEALYKKCSHRVGDEKVNEFHRIQSDTVIAVLDYIFGTDLFKEK